MPKWDKEEDEIEEDSILLSSEYDVRASRNSEANLDLVGVKMTSKISPEENRISKRESNRRGEGGDWKGELNPPQVPLLLLNKIPIYADIIFRYPIYQFINFQNFQPTYSPFPSPPEKQRNKKLHLPSSPILVKSWTMRESTKMGEETRARLERVGAG